MKIFDCFMFFDEEQILDLRLNVLNEIVDFFVIVESIYNHKGEKRELVFDKNKFSKFRDKIIYLIHDEIPKEVETINQNDNENMLLLSDRHKYQFRLVAYLLQNNQNVEPLHHPQALLQDQK